MMPIYPHTVEEHKLHNRTVMIRSGEGSVTYNYNYLVCQECGFCQCKELEGLHATNCSNYDHSGAGDEYREEE